MAVVVPLTLDGESQGHLELTIRIELDPPNLRRAFNHFLSPVFYSVRGFLLYQVASSAVASGAIVSSAIVSSAIASSAIVSSAIVRSAIASNSIVRKCHSK